MTGTLESAAALALSASILATVGASMVSAVRLGAACEDFAAGLFAERQLEHLVDRTVGSAGAGPGRPAPLASLDDADAVFAADLDGDGVVATVGAETTALEVRQDGDQARVRLRLGRQTMTVLQLDETQVSMRATDLDGREADAESASLIEVELRATTSPSALDDTGVRRLRFAVPARSLW